MTVEVHGPLFDGRADAAIKAMMREIESTVARRGVQMVQHNLNAVLRKQTPRYRLSIHAEGYSPTRVTDGNIIYGNWLEGTGSRNRSTRFKGYATFRRTRQELDRAAEPIANSVARRYIGRMS